MDFVKNEKINELLDVYGLMLTQKQQTVMEDYFMYDLSLQEIADNLGVSRNAVFDMIKRTTLILENFEDKIKVIEKRIKIREEIKDLAEDIKNKIEDII